MPPELAAAPVVAPAVVVPAADQPPAPSAPKSFADRWKAVESQVDDGVADEPEVPAAAPKAAPEKPGPAAADPKEAKRSQLKALATELGLHFDESGVSTQDAIEIRAAKRRNLEWKAAREAEFAKKEAEFTTTHGEKLKKTTAILDAFERGDPESFAQALGAKDFNELQQSWIKRLADPNYMELRKLQLESEERRNKETQAAKDAEQAAAARQRTEIRQGYMRSLAEQCKASTNPLLREMHDDPAFLQDIYRIQEENWDDDAQKTVTLDEAIKMAIKGGKVTLEEWHKKNAERYSRVYGQPAAAAPPVAAAAPLKGGKKPAPKTAVVPSTSTAAAGAPLKPGDMTPQAWRKYANARLAEADD